MYFICFEWIGIPNKFIFWHQKVGQKVIIPSRRQPKCEFGYMLKKSRANFTLSCTFSSYICQRNELENGGKKVTVEVIWAHSVWIFQKKIRQRFHIKDNFKISLIFCAKIQRQFKSRRQFWRFSNTMQYIFRLKITVIFYAEYLSFSQ